MIIPVSVQMKGEKEAHCRLAVVLPDAYGPTDLINYRNALMECIKAILATDELQGYLDDELWWLMQLTEYINAGLDEALEKKGGSHERA